MKKVVLKSTYRESSQMIRIWINTVQSQPIRSLHSKLMYDNYIVLEQLPAHLRVNLDLDVSIMENLAWFDMIFYLKTMALICFSKGTTLKKI